MSKENQQAVDEFLGDLKKDQSNDPFDASQDDPFKSEQEEKDDEKKGNAAESGESKEGEDEDEKPLPFHKDPKVERYVEKKVAKALAEANIQPSRSEAQQLVQSIKDGEGDELMDILTEVIGNDTPEKVAATKRLKKALEGIEERGAQKAIQKWQEGEKQKRDAEVKAETDLEEGFDSIEDHFEVDLSSNKPTARKLRAEFIEHVRKIAPKDANGEIKEFPDFIGAFESFQERKQPSNQQANRSKELAARGLSRSGDASAVKPTGDRSWSAVDRLFSNLDN